MSGETDGRSLGRQSRGRAPLKRLKLLHSSQPAIDLGAGELAHIFFSLQMGCETALADEFYFMAVFEIDMTAPCPSVRVRILLDYADEWLIAMGILNPVSLAVFRAGLHSATVVVVHDYSKRDARLYTRVWHHASELSYHRTSFFKGQRTLSSRRIQTALTLLFYPEHALKMLQPSKAYLRAPSGRDCRSTGGARGDSSPRLVLLSLASPMSSRI